MKRKLNMESLVCFSLATVISLCVMSTTITKAAEAPESEDYLVKQEVTAESAGSSTLYAADTIPKFEAKSSLTGEFILNDSTDTTTEIMMERTLKNNIVSQLNPIKITSNGLEILSNKLNTFIEVDESTYNNVSSIELDKLSGNEFIDIYSSNYQVQYTFSSGAVIINKMLYKGDKLRTIYDIPDKVNYVWCSEKKAETIDGIKHCYLKLDTNSAFVTSITTAFSGSEQLDNCTAVQQEVIVPIRVTDLASGAFMGNTKLYAAEFKGNINSMGDSTFRECTALEDLKINLKNINNNSIPSYCFYKCQSLNNLYSSDPDKGIISGNIQNIGNQAFYQCDKLDIAMFGESMKNIGRDAFSDCANLRWIYIKSNYNDDWSSIVSSSEVNKVIKSPMTTKPIVVNYGKNSEIPNEIFNAPGKVQIACGIDLESMTVTKNGNTVNLADCTSNIYGYTTTSKCFDINTGDYGTYIITATDILGNTSTKTIKYEKDVNDTVPPVITLTGDGSKEKLIYKNVKVEFSDADTYIKEATIVQIDKVDKYGNIIECTPTTIKNGDIISQDGKYKVVVTDAFDLKSEITFTIDNKKPIIAENSYKTKEITNGTMFSDALSYKIVENNGLDNIKYVKVNGNAVQISDIMSLNKSGKYTIDVEDFAGNTNSVLIIIDMDYPILNGVLNNMKTNTSVKIDAYALSGVKKITYSLSALDGTTDQGTLSNGDVLTRSGDYKIVVCNNIDIENRYSITINNQKPSITGASNNKYYNSNVNIKVSSNGKYTTKVNGKQSNILKFSQDGKYTIEVTDEYGNSSSITFYIDKTAPKITGVKDKAKLKKATEIYFSDSYGIASAKLNNKSIKSGTLVYKPGKYKLVVKDLAGNTKTVSFEVAKDKIKPTVNVKKNKTYKKGFTLKCSDKGLGIKSITLNKKKISNKYKITKKGKYTVVVTDYAGNKTTVKFKVK